MNSNSVFSSFMILLVLVVIVVNVSLNYADAVSIDLNDWVQEGPPDNGSWRVDPSGAFVTQSKNGDPTMYVSPKGDEFINTSITGKIEINDLGDDDYIGFILGFNDSVNDEFIVVDWRAGLQDGSEPGFTLARVIGGPNSIPFANHHVSTENWIVLDTNVEVGGWESNEVYEFTIGYYSDQISVKVSGGKFGNNAKTVLDSGGSFSKGRIGFYNYSQENVKYSTYEYNLEILTPTQTVAIGAGSAVAVGTGVAVAVKVGIIGSKTAAVAASHGGTSAISSTSNGGSSGSSGTGGEEAVQTEPHDDIEIHHEAVVNFKISGGIE